MKALVRRLSRSARFPLLPLLLLAAAVVMGGRLLVAGLGAEPEVSGSSLVGLVIVGVAVIAGVLVVTRLAVLLAGVDPEADLIAGGLVTGADQQRLLSRWLQRTRWARNVGGLAGIAWWIFGTFGLGDLLLFGVGGLAIGSIAAQFHHVRRVGGLRTASLKRRSIAAYLPSGWRRRMIAVASAAAALCLAGLIIGSRSTVWFSLAATSVIGLAHLAQRRVANRPRAALPPALLDADDVVRALAIDRGLAQPAFYFALVLIAHGASGLVSDVGSMATVISLGAWLYALCAWLSNRRLGLDFAMTQPPLAPGAP